jgi:putative phage-type endonuclease
VTAQLIETGTEAGWLAARRKGVTASEIAVVMGLSPYDSPFALYHRKRGDLPEVEDSDAMERGRILEPYIAGKFTQRRPEFGVSGDGRELYARPDRPWQMATPDRILWEGGDQGTYTNYRGETMPWQEADGQSPVAVLETKTDAGGDDQWGDDGSDQIPVHYRCQVLWQMDVMGVTAAYVACLAMRSWKLRVYELTMDGDAEADLKIMRDTAECFLDDIRDGRAPDVDWRPQTAAALKHLHPKVEDREAVVGVRTAISYRAACRRYKEAERRKNEMTNRLRAEMGSALRAVTWRGAEVAARQVYEVKEHTRKASTTDKLVPARPPKDAAS